MKLRRIKKEVAVGPRGFTRWIQPVARGYKLACCDCGLVHEMDFRVELGRVQFRARRAEAYTRKQRAKKSKQ